MTLEALLSRLTVAPAHVLGLPAGRLTPGAAADIVIFDPAAEWTVEPAAFQSLGRNTPFAGERLRGRVWGAIVGGAFRYRDGRPAD